MKIGLILIETGSLWAQDGRIAGPTTGFVFDRGARSLRPVLGVPGAATIGAPMSPGAELAAAWVAPKLDFAIARTTEGALKLFRIDSGAVTGIELDGSVSGPQNVTFSPAGGSALLTTAGGAFVLTGMPNQPRVAGIVGIDINESPRRGAPRTPIGKQAARVSTAVSDDGAYVLVAANGTVRVMTTSGENRMLTDATDAVVAFAPGSHDAVAASAVSGITVYRNLDGAPAPTVLSAREDFGSANGAAFSADGKRIFVSAAGAHGVMSYDAATGAKNVIQCECSPGSLVRMGNVFRLNDLSSEPLWILDLAGSEPRIVFVPAMAEN